MKEIIEFLPELFAYFIPGAITLTIYNFIFLKKQDHSAFIFWAIIISYIVKIVVDACVITRFNGVIYVVTCTMLPFILYGLQRIGLIDRLFSYLRLSDIQNIWLSTLDLDGCNYIIVYLSDGRAYCGLIHQADDDWLILTNYNSVLAKKTDENSKSKDDEPCDQILCIPMSNIECFEMAYDDGSPKIKEFYPFD